MVRYCSCNRGIGFSNRTSVVPNSVGQEICSHCGGVVPPKRSYNYDPYRYPNGFEGEEDPFLSRMKELYSDARSASSKGDHLTAIKCYKDILKQFGYNCDVLAYIADEYESMGDYASAEEYWNKCCSFEKRDIYKFIARKGDFLYRRGRFQEAVDTYEEVFKLMKDVKGRNFTLAMLKCYARTAHFIIDSYKTLGVDNTREKYHSELKWAIGRYRQSRWAENSETDANYIFRTATEIYNKDKIADEAMILLDLAIEIHPDCPADYYNRKAIILDDAFRYEETLKYYDMALAKDGSDEIILKNRNGCEADCIKSKLQIRVTVKDIKPQHLDLINHALKILPDDYDNAPYLKLKSDILRLLGDPVKAKICLAIAYKNYDKVDEAEKQLKKLTPYFRYINITGIHNYCHFEPFKEGVIVDLIKEPDNPYDRDAIRAEIDGETVGYVANSEYTLIKEVKSASDIVHTRLTQAKVMFILFDEWVIAKLI